MTATAIARPAGVSSDSALRRSASIVGHQLRYDTVAVLRNRQARFFTLGLPVGMMLLFVSIFGRGMVPVGGGRLADGTTYYVTSQTVFGIVDAAFMALAVAVVTQREQGVLKRRRGTPEPAWVVIASRTVLSVGLALATASELSLVGRVAFGMPLPLSACCQISLVVVIGAAAYCCLGFAVSTFIGNPDAAMPVVTAATLPLFFISGIFVPWGMIPAWLQRLAIVTPVRHLAIVVRAPLRPSSGAFPWASLGVIAGWGVAGLLVALARFRWSPTTR